MSFNEKSSTSHVTQPTSSEFNQLTATILKITNNTAVLHKLTLQLGTIKDSFETRRKLNEKIEISRSLIKTAAETLHSYTQHPSSQPDIHIQQQKIKKQYENAIQAFQHQSRLAAEKTRQFVINRPTNDYNQSHHEESDENHPLLLQQTKRKQLQSKALDHDITFNEALIEERDADLRNIEHSIIEVNEIFRDLGTLVNEQQFQLDNIESNVNGVVVHMENATTELRSANRYHQLANKRCWWILIIMFFITLTIIVIVL